MFNMNKGLNLRNNPNLNGNTQEAFFNTVIGIVLKIKKLYIFCLHMGLIPLPLYH